MRTLIIAVIAVLIIGFAFFYFNNGLDAMINVEAPRQNDIVNSPLTVKGEARGTWYFEASFPVTLYDANGNILAQAPAQAEADWMTEDFVPFSVTLAFAPPDTQTGSLVLEKDNPSGLPEHSASITIPVRFGTSAASTLEYGPYRTILLFYQNTKKAGLVGDDCSTETLESVERRVPVSQSPIADAIKMHIRGELTAKERQEGFVTEFPNKGFELKSLNLNKDGLLTIEFSEVPGFTSGGSCRTAVLAGSIARTALQFKEVKEVRFMPSEIFQP